MVETVTVFRAKQTGHKSSTVGNSTPYFTLKEATQTKRTIIWQVRLNNERKHEHKKARLQ